APVISENAKNDSPRMSQSALKLPTVSPTRSNQPSVRMASKGNRSGAAMSGVTLARNPRQFKDLLRPRSSKSSLVPPAPRLIQAFARRVASPVSQTWFAEQLLAWYSRHRRDLPWRRTRDPYAIWVSEIMLQQTQVATVMDYFRRFMQRFPTIEALAASDED